MDKTFTITIHDNDDRAAIEAMPIELSAEWCKCGELETFGCYPDDGECTCGVHKHHVHCGTCGKVSQVG